MLPDHLIRFDWCTILNSEGLGGVGALPYGKVSPNML